MDRDACPGAFIPAKLLEEVVLREIKHLSSKYLDREALSTAIALQNPLEAKRTVLEDTISSRKKKLGEYASALRKLYMDRVNGVLDEESFSLLLNELNQNKSHLETLISSDENRLKQLSAQDTVEFSSEQLERCLNPKLLTRDMVELLIDYITVGRRAPGAKAPPIEIHWNF